MYIYFYFRADDWISKVPFAVFSLSFAIFMAAIVTGLELWKPWRTEILPSPAIVGFASPSIPHSRLPHVLSYLSSLGFIYIWGAELDERGYVG